MPVVSLTVRTPRAAGRGLIQPDKTRLHRPLPLLGNARTSKHCSRLVPDGLAEPAVDMLHRGRPGWTATRSHVNRSQGIVAAPWRTAPRPVIAFAPPGPFASTIIHGGHGCEVCWALKCSQRRALQQPVWYGSSMFIDFTEIRDGGDDWEAFTRDFLVALGFAIDSPPNRGADGGKDLLVLEHLTGTLNRYPLRWLVSCKHKAVSGRSVSEADEPNILERMRSFRADGFLGVYSTVPSSGLSERLRALVDARDIRDFKIFDARLIENHLIRLGYSQLLMRFFPVAYGRLKPLHAVTGKYQPLECRVCGRDLLDAIGLEGFVGLVASIVRSADDGDDEEVVDFYWACKGNCDTRITYAGAARGLATRWEDISDLANPAWYLRWILTTLNELRAGGVAWSDQAHESHKQFLIALGQRVLRELTEEERKRFDKLMTIPML
jgi:hypothetical protein